MKTKKYTILLSGFLAISNAICFFILQFRLYHLLEINGNGSQLFINIREDLIVLTSGLFTSSCVVLIISIREYLDEREAALRNLLRLVRYIKEKYYQIHFFIPTIPKDIIVPYIISKYYMNKSKKYDKIMINISDNIKKQFDYLEKDDVEKIKKFRKYVWENESDMIKAIYTTEEEKEKYLDKKCLEKEQEFLKKVKELINSLQVFRDFDVNQVQEAFDKLCFLFHKNYKSILEVCLLPYTVVNVKFIKYYINLTSTEEELFLNSLYAFVALDDALIKYSGSGEEAYLKPVYCIDYAIEFIKGILDFHTKNIKKPDIEMYKVYPFSIPNMDFGTDILWDS